jgi:hypothetical protein
LDFSAGFSALPELEYEDDEEAGFLAFFGFSDSELDDFCFFAEEGLGAISLEELESAGFLAFSSFLPGADGFFALMDSELDDDFLAFCTGLAGAFGAVFLGSSESEDEDLAFFATGFSRVLPVFFIASDELELEGFLVFLTSGIFAMGFAGVFAFLMLDDEDEDTFFPLI